ncbi:MAG: hypothetical protein Q4A71_07485 [Actinomycetaceae bacterium]|nr:hypothetical protein [Actinomycetaceae bacterium]
MEIFKRILKSLTIAFIATAILTAATIIKLMFIDGRAKGHHVGLFGSLFFDARETGTGSINVGLGVENPLILTIIFVILFLFFILVLTIFSGLQERKKILEQRANNPNE